MAQIHVTLDEVVGYFDDTSVYDNRFRVGVLGSKALGGVVR